MRAEIVNRAVEVSQDVLRAHAAAADRENRFPHESMEALQQAGLIALMAPPQVGGGGGSVRELAEVAAALGEECLSTALIWGMHSQQVSLIARHAHASQIHLLERVVGGTLVASVTSEPGRGADVWSSECPLFEEAGKLRVKREAPVVSYGAEAGLFLVKMLAAEGRPPSDVAMVLVGREEGDVRMEEGWDAMGMRGTRSIPMRFDMTVEPSRILGQRYRDMALDTMLPFGYVAWSSAWLGAARGCYRRFVQNLRGHKGPGKRNLGSELFKHRLARLRLSLDLVDALLRRCLDAIETLEGLGAGERRQRQDETYLILLSNLKLASSEMSYEVVNGLVEIAGMWGGYLRNGQTGLERVLRDLRSASLMYHNDQLLAANGNLILMETMALGRRLSNAITAPMQ